MAENRGDGDSYHDFPYDDGSKVVAASDYNAPMCETSNNKSVMTGHEHIPTNKDDKSEGDHESAKKRNAENETMPLPVPETQGEFKGFRKDVSIPQTFQRSPLSLHVSVESGSFLQDKLDQSTDKAGLCVICSCTTPLHGEPIMNCTAPKRMDICFGTKLGYSTSDHPSLSMGDMQKLLHDLSTLRTPLSCGKDFHFLFYFFGHGTGSHICLSDGDFECSEIVTKFQKIDHTKFKIILFDSCRVVEAQCRPQAAEPMGYLAVDTNKPHQIKSLPGHSSQWEEIKSYPYVNTLVIYATDFRSNAYYSTSNEHPEMKGCGLVTHFFTTLAPTLNRSLTAVLSEVRKEVNEFIRKKALPPKRMSIPAPQVLVYEDRLMGNVNLLAESKGEERVKPQLISQNPLVLTTTVQWVFRLNVDDRIDSYRVICRDGKGNIMNIDQKSIGKNLAKFKNDKLEPNTTYHVKVAAVYKDGFEAKSEEASFTTLVRPVPQSLSITPVVRGSSSATVQWNFSGEDSDLSGFCVQVKGGMKVEVGASARKASVDGLQPTTSNLITVTAVFRDSRKTECQLNYQTDSRECAQISSVHLTQLSPLTLKIEWTEVSSQPRHFRVLSNSRVIVPRCPGTHVELPIQPGSNNSLRVDTCYEDNVYLPSNPCTYVSPAATDIEPVIEFSHVRRNSVVVTVSDPPIFLKLHKFHARDLARPKAVQVRRTPVAADKTDIGKGTNYLLWPPDGNEPPQERPAIHEKTLFGTIPGRKYRVECEMEFESGKSLKKIKYFTAKKPQCLEGMFRSPICMLLAFLVIPVICLGIAISAGVPYHKYLNGDGASATYYILNDAVIQCGAGNSQYYKGINIAGSKHPRDTLMGDFVAWLVRRDEVKRYSRQLGPFSDGYTLTNGEHFAVLERWDAYLWEGSMISGFCCVQNLNTTEHTASLHVFTSDEDVMQFQRSGKAQNFVFSETLTIPPKAKYCFEKWRQDRPLHVKKSAYHIFVLHVSADNINFTSEITYNQIYVNTSDYRYEKHFSSSSHTYFPYLSGILHPTDYVTICQAPDSITTSNNTNITRPEAVSLHILSWQSLYTWRMVLPVITTLSGLYCIEAVVVVLCLLKHQKIRICGIPKCCTLRYLRSCTSRRQYDNINDSHDTY